MRATRLQLFVLASGLALAASGIALVVTSPRRDAQEVSAKEGPAVTPGVRVPALTVTRRAFRDRVEVSGVVEPIRRVGLVAEVEGRVASLGAREHERVEAGQVIVRLDDTIRRAALARAEAAVLRARSAHRLAQIDLERKRELAAQGVASQAELDRAINQERATFGALGEALAARDEARELLKRTVIRAPFAGVLASFDVEAGDWVRFGGPIGEVLDLTRVKVEIGVTESQVIALRPGDGVELRFRVYPGRAFAAEVRRVGSAIDVATRKFPVEVVADNADGLLLPGMVTEATVEIGDEQPRIRIPREATMREFGLTYVFVLDGGGDQAVAHRRRVAVRPVAFRPSEVEVLEGLGEGEVIAAGSLRDLRDGLVVTVRERM